MTCQATADEHCCWVPGFGVCPHFDPDGQTGFCTLRAELGSWRKVHASPAYAPIKVALRAAGASTSLCGRWPVKGERCGTCEAVG